MPRNPAPRKRGSNSEHLATIFATSHPLLHREMKEFDKYGPPAGVPASAQVRAGYGEFTEHGFEIKEWGVRALLFLLRDERGAAREIIAWSPQINGLSSVCLNTAIFKEGKTVGPRLGTYQYDNQEAA